MVLLALLIAVLPVRAQAQSLRLIRDAEIENIIRIYATPLFQASGFSPQAIKVFLVQDPALNAFATSGLRMFLHTGLLMKAEDPLEVIGVIAHETGHIAAGHTVTRPDAARSTTVTVLASYVLGLAAAFASGRSELGSAIISGGQDIAIKSLLSYSRGQESAADQYAVDLLNGTEQSARGLLEFLRLVGGQETLFADRQNPYLRTHPVTAERISFMENQVERSPYGQKPAPPNLVALHARMRAKLFGFLEEPAQVLRRYPESDTSLPARYARATTYYRAGQTDKSLTLLDALIADYPDDPYFRELKGQILFDNGRIAEAVPEYETASRLLPDSSQLHLAAAQARLELDSPDQNAAALDHLRKTLRKEPGNSFAWRLNAIAYGRQGNVGMTALSLAESAIASGHVKEALNQSKRAQRILSEGSPAWLRARDLEQLSQRRVDKAAKRAN
jgi:predicted Zn-dependent protease